MDPAKTKRIRPAMYAVQFSVFFVAVSWVLAPGALWVSVPVLAVSIALLIFLALA